MKASELQVGDWISGCGIVQEINTYYTYKARKKTSRGRQLPKRITSSVKAQLATEAIKQVYKQVPRSVMVSCSTGQRSFLLDEDVCGLVRLSDQSALSTVA